MSLCQPRREASRGTSAALPQTSKANSVRKVILWFKLPMCDPLSSVRPLVAEWRAREENSHTRAHTWRGCAPFCPRSIVHISSPSSTRPKELPATSAHCGKRSPVLGCSWPSAQLRDLRCWAQEGWEWRTLLSGPVPIFMETEWPSTLLLEKCRTIRQI